MYVPDCIGLQQRTPKPLPAPVQNFSKPGAQRRFWNRRLEQASPHGQMPDVHSVNIRRLRQALPQVSSSLPACSHVHGWHNGAVAGLAST